MIFEVDFGAPQTGIGYRFEDSGGGFIGSRITTGITAGAISGQYFATATPPTGAFSIFWDCDNPLFTAEETIAVPSTTSGVAFSKSKFGMRTSNFLTDFLYGVAALLSINPDKQEFSDEFVRQWTSFLNTKVTDVWEMFDFPEFFVTEERAFRQLWRPDQDYFVGDDVYYLPASPDSPGYFTVINEPPEGTLPTNTSFFSPITALDKYIAYDQFGQRPIGEMRGVFPYNPRLVPWMNSPSLKFRPSEMGIDVDPICSGSTVFVNYKIVPSRFTSDEWDSTVTYKYGDTVFYDVDGNCYQCGVATTTSVPTDFTQWFVVPFPTILLDYLVRAVAGDAADDIQTESTLLAEAEDLLRGKLAKLAAQGQKFRYHFGQRYRKHNFDGWCCSSPWTGGFVSTLTNAVFSPLAKDRRPSWIVQTGDDVVTETGVPAVIG